ncbi:uncharacterized protein LOC143916241 isoform X1 [Arctopsyche grandis]|uniref:uncharacterized protein LOC143916241 isoform X1 n=1 Tax=Arctopsyche grandis TaxID=121162 RepID=UPI00406D75FE
MSHVNVVVVSVYTWLVDIIFNYCETVKLIDSINRVKAEISIVKCYTFNVALHSAYCISMFFIFITSSFFTEWFGFVSYIYVMFLKDDIAFVRLMMMNLLVLFQMRHLNDQLGFKLNVTLETNIFMKQNKGKDITIQDVSIQFVQKEFFKLGDIMDNILWLNNIQLILSPLNIFIGFVTSVNELIVAIDSIGIISLTHILLWATHDVSFVVGIATLSECLKYEAHRTEMILLKKMLQQSNCFVFEQLILSPVDIFIGFVTSINNLIAAFSSIEFLKCSRIVFWTIHDLSIILGITTLCECLKYESHRTELILLKKVLQQSGDEINYDAKLFLNYLYERKFLITVTDFVTLDYKFLFEFVGAVVSYTIILMQFPEGQRHLT